MNDSKKLKGKDLINIGIFTAIYFVVIMALAMLGFIPIFMPTYSVLMPLLSARDSIASFNAAVFIFVSFFLRI